MDDRIKQELKKLVTHNIYAEALGIELLELRQGYARGRMPYRLENANPYGSLHGGVVFAGGYYLWTGGMYLWLLFVDDRGEHALCAPGAQHALCGL